MRDELLTVEEAARYLKFHPVTLRNMLRAGTINGLKVGAQQWRIPESSLKAFIASRMAKPAELAGA